MGAPEHTTDDCNTLRGKLQEMIEKNQLFFNEVKPPNVQASPLPDHGSSSDAAINLISICPRGTRRSQAKSDARVHTSSRTLSGPSPFTSIGKGSDHVVPPTKPKTRTIEGITQHRCDRLP
ncbi:hypothetical protein CRG98_002703 [Punica granatum]|uniref:Uncharacterized protein n=1 Tax=Punica granatum TaxID=22663 RepID=A0A2I0L9V3_PUNGR|nr:hypothetical protein CRG98_002703 [Punica granatum]